MYQRSELLVKMICQIRKVITQYLFNTLLKIITVILSKSKVQFEECFMYVRLKVILLSKYLYDDILGDNTDH